MDIRRCFIPVLIACFIAGCGGSSGSRPVTPTPTPSPSPTPAVSPFVGAWVGGFPGTAIEFTVEANGKLIGTASRSTAPTKFAINPGELKANRFITIIWFEGTTRWYLFGTLFQSGNTLSGQMTYYKGLPKNGTYSNTLQPPVTLTIARP